MELSFNRHVDFTEEQQNGIFKTIDYAIRTDLDFRTICSNYKTINVLSVNNERKLGGYFDGDVTGSVECYFKIQFYHPDIGVSANYHILNVVKNNKIQYKGYSKINKLYKHQNTHRY